MNFDPRLADGCVPINPFGTGEISAAAKAYAFGNLDEQPDYKQSVAAINATGELFERLRLGPITAAVGAEYRVEKGTPIEELGWVRSETDKFWDHFRLVCPPSSPARNVSALPSLEEPADFLGGLCSHTPTDGYVRNATAARDPCSQPHLRGMQGSFFGSYSTDALHTLVPVFGDSKIVGANDILLPSSAYLDESWKMYSGGSSIHGGEWATKKDAMIWRGAASGSRIRPGQWYRNHRNRFVQMLNGTTAAAAQAGDMSVAKTFQLFVNDTYGVVAQNEGPARQLGILIC